MKTPKIYYTINLLRIHRYIVAHIRLSRHNRARVKGVNIKILQSVILTHTALLHPDFFIT